ncbi:Agarase [Paraglaciecola sp. T6c]|uniref:beta-galactosidase n=1 Tax=Pseudoalteromonas atlantica (strain T6c / ATCC BAA-1087) TaxID=3042615 RepID=UPI00005C6AA9|nr:beta-galactosidase [Paraglaciecola sp. T6c]ABG40489.1 Agarase [Paraglaciecola sp. T6c]
MNASKKLLFVAIVTALTGCSASETSDEVSHSSAAEVQPVDHIEQQVKTLKTLFTAKDSDSLKQVKYTNASGTVVGTSGDSLKVVFHGKENINSAVEFIPDVAWDWSDLDDFNIAFDIGNEGEHSVQLFLNISDTNGDTYTRSVSVPVGPQSTYYAKMAGHDLAKSISDDKNEFNFTSGLRSNPDTWHSDDKQFISLWGKKNLKLSGISKISLSVQNNLFDKQITINDIRLRQNPPMDTLYLTGVVDQFGQNAKREFDGKVHSLEELYSARDKELKTLDGKWNAPRSKWGGWLNGPKLEGTGNFRTAKYQGKWSLVDPDGYLYFATGVDIIRLANSSTMTGYDFPPEVLVKADNADVTPSDSQGLNRVADSAVPSRFVASELRKDLFTWLPSYEEPMGQHYGYRTGVHSGPLKQGETYSFYAANLDRKYSEMTPDYMQKWHDVTLDRMRNWGFTSLGNWTDPAFYDNQKVPFFANGWIIGDYKTVSSGDDFWGNMPDVFDPTFKERALHTVSVIAQEVKNTPWCVGVFIDNEKSFGRSETPQSRYGIVFNTLKRDGSEVPTKAAFTTMLKDKYASIEALNAAWGKNISSWSEFNKGIDSVLATDETHAEQQLADYSDMLYAYAEKYFSTVDAAMQTYLPNHLYLGSRFADWGMPMEVAKAATQYVDVMSYNVYKEGLHPKGWGFLKEFDMPSIVGEFHIGATDSGLFHPGLVHAANQQDRADMYQDYMGTIIDNPYFIGAHWFQYMDSPITGRAFDGENYNVGFVNVTDTPYAPMVNAAKDLHKGMYERRFTSN